MRLITGILTIFSGIKWFVNCQIDVESSHFQIVRPDARSFVTHGDNITYEFSITFNLSATTDHVSVVVNGSNLMMVDSSDLQSTNFTWQTPDGLTLETDDLNLAVEVIKESPLHPVPEIDLQFSTSFDSLKLHSMTGLIGLHVADTAALGCLLRPDMFISSFSDTVVFHQTVISSDYVFMKLPEIKTYFPQPNSLGMKEKSTIMASVLTPTTPMKSSSITVYMPRNFSSIAESDTVEEPYLTVTDFQFVGYSGLDEDFLRLISETNADYQSSSRTSEIDSVVLAIPGVNYNSPDFNSPLELDFLLKVEGLDFVGSSEGMEVEVVYVLGVGEQFLMIRNCSLTINRTLQVESSPNLSFNLEFIETFVEERQTNVEYQLRIWHTENSSWSSAYDVLVLIYLPPFLHGVNMQRTKDVIKTTSVIENLQHEHCIQIKIQRVSFAHNAQLQFSVTFDEYHKRYKTGEKFMIIAEILYTGWRDQKVIKYIEGFLSSLNISKENEMKPVCECIDGKLGHCRCTTNNRCNGKIDHVTCVDCNHPWHCVKTLPGHGMKSKLTVQKEESIICSASRRNTKPSEVVPCCRLKGNCTIGRLPSSVGTILGRDKSSGSLYGISQNGLAYIRSMDNGVTWYSIPPSMYVRAHDLSSFEMATLTQF